MENKEQAHKGWEKSINLAKQTRKAAGPLHKLGDGFETLEELKSNFYEQRIFLFNDGGDDWAALYADEWKQVEDFMNENPEYTEIYYSEAYHDNILIWNDEFADSYGECDWDGCDIAYGIVDYINCEREPRYEGPAVRIDMIYDGEILPVQVYPGTEDVGDWLDQQNGYDEDEEYEDEDDSWMDDED